MARRRAAPEYERVELIGIPHYSQGEADGLCVYYAMSMMIAALHPSHAPTIHDAPRYTWKGSPVFQVLKRLYRPERKFKQKIADWFFNGMSMREALTVLSSVFQKEPGAEPAFERFYVQARRARHMKHNPKKRKLLKSGTVQDVICALSWHLPVLVAGGGVGAHAVLAVGYSGKGNADRLLCFLDPGELRPQWRRPADIFYGDCEVIMPREGSFTEYRPTRIWSHGNKPAALQQWTKEDAEKERKECGL
jgi:hypothetical protein